MQLVKTQCDKNERKYSTVEYNHVLSFLLGYYVSRHGANGRHHFIKNKFREEATGYPCGFARILPRRNSTSSLRAGTPVMLVSITLLVQPHLEVYLLLFLVLYVFHSTPLLFILVTYNIQYVPSTKNFYTLRFLFCLVFFLIFFFFQYYMTCLADAF